MEGAASVDVAGFGEGWRTRLTELVVEHDVPGATLGVLQLDPATGEQRRFAVAAGVLSRRTELACTADSLFQIGSMSKVWTATVIMRLVDRGLLGLDHTLADVLPNVSLHDGLADRVTIRHLLSHTSGLDGDIITDTGRGDDCVRRYVELLAGAAINHPLGATFSYCNSGYVVLGRIIEALTGGTWDAAIRSEIAEPLGLENVYTLPEDCMMHRFAVGHEGSPAAQVGGSWTLPRSLGPAGLVTCTADDVLGFAALHLTGGRNAAGETVLAPGLVKAMQQRCVEVPDPYSLGDSWGLGWMRFDWDGRTVIGHDGNTIGQDAYLRLLPEDGLAVALLTNGGGSAELFRAVVTELFRSLAGIRVPAPVEPSGAELGDVTPLLGRYRRASRDTEVYLEDDRLMMRATVTGPLAAYYETPVMVHELHRIAGTHFAFRDDDQGHWTAVVFYQLPGGARFVHYNVRANPWIEP